MRPQFSASWPKDRGWRGERPNGLRSGHGWVAQSYKSLLRKANLAATPIQKPVRFAASASARSQVFDIDNQCEHAQYRSRSRVPETIGGEYMDTCPSSRPAVMLSRLQRAACLNRRSCVPIRPPGPDRVVEHPRPRGVNEKWTELISRPDALAFAASRYDQIGGFVTSDGSRRLTPRQFRGRGISTFGPLREHQAGMGNLGSPPVVGVRAGPPLKGVDE